MRPERSRRYRTGAVAGLRTAKHVAGFTLLESIVSLAIFAAAGMALYGLFNTNLIALNRTADVSRQVAVVRTAMDYLSSINPSHRGEGEVELGDVGVAWTSTLVEPVRQGQNTIGGLADFDIGLYDVEFVVRHEGRALGTWHLRVAGHEKARGIFPGEELF